MPNIIIHPTRAAIDLWQHMPLPAGDDERYAAISSVNKPPKMTHSFIFLKPT